VRGVGDDLEADHPAFRIVVENDMAALDHRPVLVLEFIIEVDVAVLGDGRSRRTPRPL